MERREKNWRQKRKRERERDAEKRECVDAAMRREGDQGRAKAGRAKRGRSLVAFVFVNPPESSLSAFMGGFFYFLFIYSLGDREKCDASLISFTFVYPPESPFMGFLFFWWSRKVRRELNYVTFVHPPESSFMGILFFFGDWEKCGASLSMSLLCIRQRASSWEDVFSFFW